MWHEFYMWVRYVEPKIIMYSRPGACGNANRQCVIVVNALLQHPHPLQSDRQGPFCRTLHRRQTHRQTENCVASEICLFVCDVRGDSYYIGCSSSAYSTHVLTRERERERVDGSEELLDHTRATYAVLRDRRGCGIRISQQRAVPASQHRLTSDTRRTAHRSCTIFFLYISIDMNERP